MIGNRCDKPSKWTIITGSSPDDYTASCTEHVGEMLVNGQNNVYPVNETNIPCCYVEQE